MPLILAGREPAPTQMLVAFMPLTDTLVVFQELMKLPRLAACQQKVPAPSKVKGIVMVEVTGLQPPEGEVAVGVEDGPGGGVFVWVAVGPGVNVLVGVLVGPAAPLVNDASSM